MYLLVRLGSRPKCGEDDDEDHTLDVTLSREQHMDFRRSACTQPFGLDT